MYSELVNVALIYACNAQLMCARARKYKLNNNRLCIKMSLKVNLSVDGRI